MTLREKEEDLFRRWRIGSEHFVPDGAVDDVAFLNSSPKVLLILKEVNDPKHESGWDLREVLRTETFKDTFRVIASWVEGLRNLDKELLWQDVERLTTDSRTANVKTIAAMNIKKSGGGNVTNNAKLATAAQDHLDLIQEQIEIYDADLIICCGSAVVWQIKTLPKWQLNWLVTSRGVEYSEYTANKFVIAFSHPMARTQHCFLYYGLIDAVKEIAKNHNVHWT